LIADLVAGCGAAACGRRRGSLLRLMLLRRLGSSLAAFRTALARHDAYLDLALARRRRDEALTPREFQRCCSARRRVRHQLVLFPLLLEQGGGGCRAVR